MRMEIEVEKYKEAQKRKCFDKNRERDMAQKVNVLCPETVK